MYLLILDTIMIYSSNLGYSHCNCMYAWLSPAPAWHTGLDTEKRTTWAALCLWPPDYRSERWSCLPWTCWRYSGAWSYCRSYTANMKYKWSLWNSVGYVMKFKCPACINKKIKLLTELGCDSKATQLGYFIIFFHP